MPRAGDTWAAVSVKLFDDPKMIQAGRDGRDLWLAALLYSVDHETDGLVPTGALPLLGFKCGVRNVAGAASKLVKADAWSVDPDGWRIHGFANWQQSSEERDAARKAASERSKRYRERLRKVEERRRQAADTQAEADNDHHEHHRDVTRDAHVTSRERMPRDVDGDVDVKKASSSGPYQQGISTGGTTTTTDLRLSTAIRLYADEMATRNEARDPTAYRAAIIRDPDHVTAIAELGATYPGSTADELAREYLNRRSRHPSQPRCGICGAPAHPNGAAECPLMDPA